MTISAITDLMKKSYIVFKSNLGKCFLIGLAFWTIVIVIQLFFTIVNVVPTGMVYSNEWSFGGFLVHFVISFILTIFSGGLYYAISVMRNMKIKLSDIAKGIENYFFELVKAFIAIQAIMYVLLSVVEVIIGYYPPIFSFVYLLIAIVLFCAAALVQFSFVFSYPIIVIDKADGFAALKKSAAFFRVNAGIVLGTILLVLLCLLFVFLSAGSLFTLGLYVAEINAYIGNILILLATGLLVIFMVLIYPYAAILLVNMYKTGKKVK